MDTPHTTTQVTDNGRILTWLRGPSAAIYATYFLSSWGDRMWHFGVGLYLVFFDGNQLRLAAVYGFISSGCILLFGGSIGKWVDANRRIKVVRVSLIIQNLSVALSAVGIGVLLNIDKSSNSVMFNLLAGIVMVLAVVGVLASCAYKIAIEKDWIVVIASSSSARLANLNAVTRTVDLACKALSPFLVGVVMTYGSRMMGAVFIAGWNIFSVIAEYMLLNRVYHLVPSLANKKSEKHPPTPIDKQKSEKAIEGTADGTEIVELESLVNNTSNAEPMVNNDVKSDIVESEKKALKDDYNGGNDPDGGDRRSQLQLMCSACIQLGTGWSVYMRQPVVLAGLSLACLYMTVLGFDSITIGYIFSQGVSELILGIACMLSAITGIIGTFLYTRGQKYFGLHTTGILAFSIDVFFLVFCLISIWTPGSPFHLYNPDFQQTCTSKEITETTATLPNLSAISNHMETRYRRDVMDSSLIAYKDYQSAHSGLNLLAVNTRNIFSRVRRNVDYDNSTQNGTTFAVTIDYSDRPLQIDDVIDDNGTTVSSGKDNCDKRNAPNASVILFLVGIIASRIGLWMADLTVTQLYQEQVIEQERGVVGGVQSSLNMMLDMLKFVAVIFLPKIHLFGYLIIMSFLFIFLALVLFSAHVGRVKREERKALQAPPKNIIFKPKGGNKQVYV